MEYLDLLIKNLVNHKIQLKSVHMIKVEAAYNHDVSLDEKRDKLTVEVANNGNVINKYQSEAILELKVFFEDVEPSPFNIHVVFRGLCETEEDIPEHLLKKFAELQSIPLLWPYIRQALSDIMTKMSIDPILLPTMDVLQTFAKISKIDDKEK